MAGIYRWTPKINRVYLTLLYNSCWHFEPRNICGGRLRHVSLPSRGFRRVNFIFRSATRYRYCLWSMQNVQLSSFPIEILPLIPNSVFPKSDIVKKKKTFAYRIYRTISWMKNKAHHERRKFPDHLPFALFITLIISYLRGTNDILRGS